MVLTVGGVFGGVLAKVTQSRTQCLNRTRGDSPTARTAWGRLLSLLRSPGVALLAIAALFALVALLALPAPAPAQTQVQVWRGTLTTYGWGSFYGCTNDDSAGLAPGAGQCGSALSDDDFVLDGTTYGIRELSLKDSVLELAIVFDKDLLVGRAQNMTLNITNPTSSYTFTAGARGSRDKRTWTTSLSWSGWATGSTVNFTLTVPNAAPTAANNTVTTNQDTAYTFTAANFNFADADTGDELDHVEIVTVPSPGSLRLDGTLVTANQDVTKDDIDAAKLVFTPAAGGSGSPYTTFDFKVSDGTAESASDYTMTVNVVRANAVATGAPAIAGTVQVGMDLTASAGTIADADGLVGVTYSYQWIQVDGGNETDISGATGSTYTLLTADVGKTLKVRASFTDEAGFAESRTSAETATVAAASVATGIADASGAEGAAITFTVTLAAAAAQDVTVNYETSVAAADTAAQADFTAGSGTLTFAPGETQKTFTVSTLQDRIDESAETFTVTLSDVDPASVATLPPDPAATGTINDDDDAPMLVLSVAPASIAEDGGTSTVTVSTGLGSTFPDDQAITLALLGTATESVDYTINSKSLTLSAGVGSGASTVTATVTAVNDTLSEGGETVLIDATRAPGNLAVGTRQTLTIIDDDRRATGAPAIAGTAQVGMDLTASAGTIADADGLTNVSYNYQWIQVDGGTETDISGETGSTYTLLPADVGKTLKVRASFTDDAGFAESRTSDATDTVIAAANNAPTALDASVTTDEDTAYTFAAADFHFADSDGNALASVTVVTLPAAGGAGARRHAGDDGPVGPGGGHRQAGVHAGGERQRGGLRELHLQGSRRHGRERVGLHDDGERDGDERPGHGRADDQRHRAGGPDPDGGDGRHRGRGGPHQSHLRVPVGPSGCRWHVEPGRHPQWCDLGHLHTGGRGCRQEAQGEGELHRRRQ